MNGTGSIENNLSGSGPEILMPLPDRGFDLTEAAIPWEACISRGWRVAFSTEHGEIAQADLNKLKGPLPGLLSASQKARAAYQRMVEDPDYRHPIPYAEIDPTHYRALLLPGGDAPGERQYLDSALLREKVLLFWQQGKLVGAICHGVLVLARTIDPNTGCSLLFGRKVTVPPKTLDRAGYLLDAWLVKHGYIMYSSCVEDEVRACLQRPEDLSTGRSILTPYVVVDGNLITARWYFDAEVFGERFAGALDQRLRAGSTFFGAYS